MTRTGQITSLALLLSIASANLPACDYGCDLEPNFLLDDVISGSHLTSECVQDGMTPGDDRGAQRGQWFRATGASTDSRIQVTGSANSLAYAGMGIEVWAVDPTEEWVLGEGCNPAAILIGRDDSGTYSGASSYHSILTDCVPEGHSDIYIRVSASAVGTWEYAYAFDVWHIEDSCEDPE